MPVDLDLDVLEREDTVDLFTVTIGKREYVLPDAKAMDYRDALKLVMLINAKEFPEAMELLLSREDREAFFANDLPIFKMEQLFLRYRAHYGVSERAAGEAPASSPS